MAEFSYLKLPAELLKSRKLTAIDKMVLADVAYFDFTERDYCFANENLAVKFGVSRRTIVNSIARLKAFALIKDNQLDHKGRYVRQVELTDPGKALFGLEGEEVAPCKDKEVAEVATCSAKEGAEVATCSDEEGAEGAKVATSEAKEVAIVATEIITNKEITEKKRCSQKVFVYDSYRLAKLLFELILENDPGHKLPKLKKWAEHVDKLIRLDKRKPEDIEKIIRWCQTDDFWHSNILSTSKLREKFSTLFLQSNSKGKYHEKKRTSKPGRCYKHQPTAGAKQFTG